MTAPHHGAKGAVFCGDRLITLLRDDLPGLIYANLWDLPGGGREGDETPFQTFAREVQEELGLIVPQDAIVWEDAVPSEDSPGHWVAFFVAHLAPEAAQDITFGDEGQGWTLMEPWDFLRLPNRVPHYGHRLGRWLDQTAGAPILGRVAEPTPKPR